jgi:acetyltransferase-like isoleucine patch superfamily enzyme
MNPQKSLERAAGLARRFKTWLWTAAVRGRFRRFGAGSTVEPTSSFNWPSAVEIGERVEIRELAWFNCLPREDGKPSLVIGDGCYLGRFVHINAFNDIRLESDVMIADRVYIADTDHFYKDPEVPIMHQGDQIKGPVLLKKGCWIGTGAAILPGVTVGRNAVVGPNTVLHKDVPDYGMAFGNPAKVVLRADAPAK